MGDRTQVTFTIGGEVPADRLDDLLEAIKAEGFGPEWEGPDNDRLREMIAAGEVFHITGNEVNYATAEAIESICKELVLPYRKEWDAGGGYGPGIEIFDGQGFREYPSAGISYSGALLSVETFATLNTREDVAAWFAASHFEPPVLKVKA